ncbi:MAG: DNA-directed RNA polymerase subunit beta' [Parcubacteria group bacterium]|nr:DNA-directed RNA polymerase subunit beta' [Parcubacteria group bacterium]
MATTQHNDIQFSRDFNAMILKLASPDNIRSWSHGEVMKAETINYRTGRAERGGLFDERTFGPSKDYECYCGKYRRIRYKNIVCEKCGVEVTRSIVRRERMGHIELASPVAHIWFVRNIPSRVGLLLDLTLADVERVIYFSGYIITEIHEDERKRVERDLASELKTRLKTAADKNEQARIKELFNQTKQELEGLKVGLVLDGARYQRFSMRFSTVFSAEIGAEALYKMLSRMDLAAEEASLREALLHAPAAARGKLHKRLGLVRSLRHAGVRPEWMFLSVIPVMPPALRPMVPLDGGRHATSDVNDLYRRVINRNNRLKKLIDVRAPEVILRNEKRILQEAVDSLIDNAMRRGSSPVQAMNQKRELKSLAENLKGKQGLFRQNLLGKRVDYSGRSVIVVGPTMRLNQCGLPKHMALELFRPFVISKILERELAFNIRGANRLIEEAGPEVWAILEEVIKDKYVLLNRAPTLHRLGIQAFKPVLLETDAIELHPLVCPAFNADFDGDQMAVHVPLSEQAQTEAREIMAADKNILKPGNAEPTVSAKMLDIVLGCFWVTKKISGARGEGKIFPSPNVAITVYDFGDVDLRAAVKVLGTDSPKYAVFSGVPFETTVGRLLFNSILPSEYPFINEDVDRKLIADIINNLIDQYDFEQVASILDRIKDFGFKYATKSGITWSYSDMRVPEEKADIVSSALGMTEQLKKQYEEGLLSEDERYRKTIEIWHRTKLSIEEKMPQTLDQNGPVYDMWKSGARGQIGQITQMSGMKGLITNTVGRALSHPVISSYKEGLTPVEYFITTHGARYGLTATALQTAKAGYLTRRLVDVAQDVIISEEDCGDRMGRRIDPKADISGIGVPLVKIIGGRVLAKDAISSSGKVVVPKGTLLRRAHVREIEAREVGEIFVRTPLACKARRGLCRACYGLDLGRYRPVAMGEAVGIVAAQAIGEPGTQLTMRTFHLGGVAGEDITMGLPRVEEIFERRPPKIPATVCHDDGRVIDIKKGAKREQIIVILPESGPRRGKAEAIEYVIPFGRTPTVAVGNEVTKGDLITDGSADLSDLFKYGGQTVAEDYVINEIARIYDLQGASISRKHIEVIVRQMFSRRRIRHIGDTRFTVGDVVEAVLFEEENERVRGEGGEEAKADQAILGISEVAITTQSFLSAASFQNTTRVLIRSALRGAVDTLRGLKENVILGRLIPAGTGFYAPSKKERKSKDETEEAEETKGTAAS